MSLLKIIAGFENDPDIRPGAQPVEVIGNALRQAWAEAHPTKTFAAAADADGHCDDCKLPS